MTSLLLLASIAAAEPPERWAGTMAVFGERHIPLLGTIRYRTDTFVLSTVRPTADGWALEQATCRVRFPKTAGATVSIDPTAPSRMPISELAFQSAGETWSAEPWASGWNADDHDGDGKPGITIHVKAPLCGGDLYVESRASSTASGAPGEDTVLEGTIAVTVEQIMHGTRGACLSLMARDTTETLHGRFAYVRVPQDATCATLSAETWPDPIPEAP